MNNNIHLTMFSKDGKAYYRVSVSEKVGGDKEYDVKLKTADYLDAVAYKAKLIRESC